MRNRRTTPTLALLAAGALVASAVVAPASARSPVERVTLGEVNVISGDHISGMEVNIPRPVTIEGDPFSNDDVSYSGNGRVVGVVLVEDDPSARRPFQMVSVRWSFCGSPGCKPDPYTDELTYTSDWRGKRWRIPAGDYRLYLVADGEDATVTLRLPELEGRTSLRPSYRVGGGITAPKPTGVSLPTDHLYLGRAKPVVMPAAGLLIDGDSVEHGLGPSAGARGSCFWRGRGEETLEEQIPGPHCVTFAKNSGFGSGFSVLGGGSAAWGLRNVSAGRWRSSYWAANAAAVPDTEFVTLWVAYEDLVR